MLNPRGVEGGGHLSKQHSVEIPRAVLAIGCDVEAIVRVFASSIDVLIL